METLSHSYISTFVQAFNKIFTTDSPETLGVNEWTDTHQQLNDPRISFLEERIAALEKGVGALAVKSLKSARFKVIHNLLSKGDNVVTFNSWSLAKEDKYLYDRLGIEIRLSEEGGLKEFKSLVDAKTKLLYLETISPKHVNVPDFGKIIAYAQELKIPVVVDNTASVGGALFAPLKNKVNLVIESLDEYLPLSSKLRAVIVDGGNYNWYNGKFEKLNQERLKFYNAATGVELEREALPSFYLIDLLRKKSSNKYNNYLIPQDPFLLVRKLDEMQSKVKQRSENALKLAHGLKENRFVSTVEYTGLPSSQGYFQALSFFRYGFGQYLAFTLSVNTEGVEYFLEQLEAIPALRNRTSFEPATKRILLSVPAIDYSDLNGYLGQAFAQLREHIESQHIIHAPWLDYVDL